MNVHLIHVMVMQLVLHHLLERPTVFVPMDGQAQIVTKILQIVMSPSHPVIMGEHAEMFQGPLSVIVCLDLLVSS